ncbi:hypothetical protein QJQ45_028812 [Haematococcus lacustris]|nr:hypothetical protein QJQ45_028812 [Haematococcus lacustris]
MGRKVLVAVDESPHSRAMLDFALRFQAIHRATDQLHLVTVLPPPSVVPFPSAPLATSAAITTVQFSLDAQRKADQEKAATMLRLVADLLCTDYRVPKDNLHPHVLPATGEHQVGIEVHQVGIEVHQVGIEVHQVGIEEHQVGVRPGQWCCRQVGVSESLLGFAKAYHIDLLVLGSRGMGMVRSALMSLLGMGSVSDALLRAAPCPLLLVKCDPAKIGKPTAEAEPPPSGPVVKRVLVAYDESPSAQAALNWALEQLLGPHDHLHIASVSVPVVVPLMDEPGAAAAMQSAEARAEQDNAALCAGRTAELAAELAVSWRSMQGCMQGGTGAGSILAPAYEAFHLVSLWCACDKMLCKAQALRLEVNPGSKAVDLSRVTLQLRCWCTWVEQRDLATEVLACLDAPGPSHPHHTQVSRGVTRTKITTKVLQPQGGSSDAGSALVAYAHDKAVNVVVVGSRGLGAVQRQLMNLVGLGSVSEYLAHNLHCALAVVHPRGEDGSGGGEKGLSGFGARGSTGDNVSFQVCAGLGLLAGHPRDGRGGGGVGERVGSGVGVHSGLTGIVRGTCWGFWLHSLKTARSHTSL